MTKTQAISQAIAESSMHYMGGGYALSTYDPTVNAFREGPSKPHHAAANALSAWRVGRATELLGGDRNAAEYDFLSAHNPGRWQKWVKA